MSSWSLVSLSPPDTVPETFSCNVDGGEARHDCVTLTYSGVMDCHHLVDDLAARPEDGGEVQDGEHADRVPGRKCYILLDSNHHKDNKLISYIDDIQLYDLSIKQRPKVIMECRLENIYLTE